MGIRFWRVSDSDPEQIHSLTQKTGYSKILCEVLCARGIRDADEAACFLGGGGVLGDPYIMADMEKAVRRIREALEDGERIAVYGDYDCDGITATALLTSYFQAVGADVIYYIPSRNKEGYGLNTAAVELLHQQGASLIVTVDNGISAHNEILYASSLGMDVVVTDHHTPRETLPQAAAVVNPHRADCPSRFKDFAGVGVAFKLVCALEDAWGEEQLEYYSEIIALGTIADIVPLTGENRIIVRHGLERLSETQNPGLSALIEASCLRDRRITSESAAFGLIPRINAAGRVGTADDVVELLLTESTECAREIAERVCEQNLLRKKLEDQILEQADGILSQNPQILNQRILIAAGENWHHGVVGIVASRMMERWGKPVILFSVEGGEARGSGRSIRGFSLIEAVSACSERLTRFGGHTLAAGMSLPAEHLEEFCAAIQEYAEKRYAVMPVQELCADCVLTPEELTAENFACLEALEPFGAGNETPVFCVTGLKIEGVYPTSDAKHIRIRLSGMGARFYAIYFGVSEAVFPYKTGETVDIMAKISISEYNNKTQLSVKISDLRLSDIQQGQFIEGRERYARYLRGEPDFSGSFPQAPSREDIADIYKYLRRCGRFPFGEDILYIRMMARNLDYCKMLLALDVLEEMGFIRRETDGANTVYSFVPGAPRADLSQSAILTKLRA